MPWTTILNLLDENGAVLDTKNITDPKPRYSIPTLANEITRMMKNADWKKIQVTVERSDG